MNAEGQICESREDIEACLSFFYGKLFTSEGSRGEEEILHLMPQSITDEMNQDLVAPYTKEKVKDALFSLDPNKYAGENGVCQEISKLCAAYCWSKGEEHKHGMHWNSCSWAKRIWGITPICWDGLEENTKSFRYWWWGVWAMDRRVIFEDRFLLTTNIL